MSDTVIERVGVVGCGLMGSGIAEVSARAGLQVTVTEYSPTAMEAGMARVAASLKRAVSSGRLSDADHDATWRRLSFGHELDALADCDVVVEAVAEHEPTKLDVFGKLDAICKPEAVLASNTSSIPIMKLARATKREAHVIGIHFFNPVPVLPLVELVTSLLTSPETATDMEHFASDKLGKTVIRSRDRAGFIVNALLIPYLLAAIRMLESGFATADDIDTGMVKGCAHPMGPLRLADLIGLDTVQAVAESLYSEFKEQLYAPPSLLLRMVEAGLLGRKTGRGFYEY
ncbi:MAG TPA: 3-hydroxybutyryl-CoA dehydrogenase [Ilumatobacteraceae bacterium]|nr:3-hydroxybutyryl-CoA dehydrogenase [Ilumatobacteraceae bacterium]